MAKVRSKKNIIKKLWGRVFKIVKINERKYELKKKSVTEKNDKSNTTSKDNEKILTQTDKKSSIITEMAKMPEFIEDSQIYTSDVSMSDNSTASLSDAGQQDFNIGENLTFNEKRFEIIKNKEETEKGYSINKTTNSDYKEVNDVIIDDSKIPKNIKHGNSMRGRIESMPESPKQKESKLQVTPEPKGEKPPVLPEWKDSKPPVSSEPCKTFLYRKYYLGDESINNFAKGIKNPENNPKVNQGNNSVKYK